MEIIYNMEHWKSVQGYAGMYQVSTSGNVRSLDRIIETSRGVKQRRQGVVLRPRINQEGYRKVTLYKQGRGERFYEMVENTCDFSREMNRLRTRDGFSRPDYSISPPPYESTHKLLQQRMKSIFLSDTTQSLSLDLSGI